MSVWFCSHWHRSALIVCTMTSKAEYLKRYMSEESVNKKKKKEKKPVGDKSR